MTKKNIFDFKSYRAYLKAHFNPSTGQHGFKKKFAESILCQGSFVSQVLAGKADLSLDQGYRAATFWGLSEEETEYFLLLLQKERAGDFAYREHLEARIQKCLERHTDLKSKVTTNTSLTLEVQSEYYSSWIYAAIHMAASLPTCQSPLAISTHLHLHLETVNYVLGFLSTHQLIEIEQGRIKMGRTHIHLPAESVLVKTHHTNWRNKAVQSLDQKRSLDLHYSVIYSLSREDALSLKLRFAELIEENMKRVAPSPEEVLFVNTIDFFEV